MSRELCRVEERGESYAELENWGESYAEVDNGGRVMNK